MKALRLFLVFFLVVITNCTSPAAIDNVKEAIPGTYIRFGQQEYGTEWDTLVISVQNPSANEYKIQRAWKYARVLDGKAIEPEYKKRSTSAVYDGKAKVLNERETGNSYSFKPDENAVFAGTTKYLKLK